MVAVHGHRRKRIVIVGGTAAGPSAAAKAKRVNPDCDVTLFEAGSTISYGVCETPYAIGGTIADEPALISYTPDRLRDEKGVEVRIRHVVEAIDPAHHLLRVRDIDSRRTNDVAYDRLILATGARPKPLGMKGESARNLFHLRSREQTTGILDFLARESPKNAVIIGGGYIGLELADAFRSRGLDVTLIHAHALPLGSTEPECGRAIIDELNRHDVHAVLDARVEALIESGAHRISHVVTNRGTFEADLVMVAIGIEPQTAIARDARIRVGMSGGILTDERQMTSVDDIYAAGDCCEVKSIVTGKPVYLPLATLASRCGWVAGENAAGGKATFKGAVGASAVRVFGLEVAQVGLTLARAEAAGLKVVKETVTTYDRIRLMPGSSRVHLHLVVERQTGRVIGANLYGAAGAVQRANTLSAVIQQRMTVNDVARLDLIYAPPFAPLWDPILVAANQAKKNLRKE